MKKATTKLKPKPKATSGRVMRASLANRRRMVMADLEIYELRLRGHSFASIANLCRLRGVSIYQESIRQTFLDVQKALESGDEVDHRKLNIERLEVSMSRLLDSKFFSSRDALAINELVKSHMILVYGGLPGLSKVPGGYRGAPDQAQQGLPAPGEGLPQSAYSKWGQSGDIEKAHEILTGEVMEVDE